MLILWGTKENRKVFFARDIRDKISEAMTEFLVGLHVFTGNGKVSAIAGGFGNINSYSSCDNNNDMKKVANSASLVEAFT